MFDLRRTPLFSACFCKYRCGDGLGRDRCHFEVFCALEIPPFQSHVLIACLQFMFHAFYAFACDILPGHVAFQTALSQFMTVLPNLTESCLRISRSYELPSDDALFHTLAYPDDATYILKAVSVHRGESMKSGHYVTYVREHKDSEDWVLFDDDICCLVCVLLLGSLGTFLRHPSFSGRLVVRSNTLD